MTVASDSFTLLDEAVALLKRSRGARSRQLARPTVRGALKAVVREAGQVGDHHVRALAEDLEGAAVSLPLGLGLDAATKLFPFGELFFFAGFGFYVGLGFFALSLMRLGVAARARDKVPAR